MQARHIRLCPAQLALGHSGAEGVRERGLLADVPVSSPGTEGPLGAEGLVTTHAVHRVTLFLD